MRTLNNLLIILFLISLFEHSFAQTVRSGPTSTTTTSSVSTTQNTDSADTLKLDSTLYQFEKINLPNNRILYFPIQKTMLCAKIKDIQAIKVDGDSLKISFDRNRFNKLKHNVLYNFPVKIISDVSPSTKVFITFIWDISNCNLDGSLINEDRTDDALSESTPINTKAVSKKVLPISSTEQVKVMNQQKSAKQNALPPQVAKKEVKAQIKNEPKVGQKSINEGVNDSNPNIQANVRPPELPTVTTIIGVLTYWDVEISEPLKNPIYKNYGPAKVIKGKHILADPK